MIAWLLISGGCAGELDGGRKVARWGGKVELGSSILLCEPIYMKTSTAPPFHFRRALAASPAEMARLCPCQKNENISPTSPSLLSRSASPLRPVGEGNVLVERDTATLVEVCTIEESVGAGRCGVGGVMGFSLFEDATTTFASC
jgi:hypothetical protein